MISAVDLLRDVGLEKPLDFTGKRVVIVGGGNVAMDCARTAVRANAKRVSIVYRRQEKDMTASPVEVRGAIEEGVELYTLQAPFGWSRMRRAEWQPCGLSLRSAAPTTAMAGRDL